MERKHHTLEKLANRFQWFGGRASSMSTKQVSKTVSKVMKKKPTRVPKSIRIRVGAEDAFLERSGRALGGQMPKVRVSVLGAFSHTN